jgi:hypothetical protein
LNQLLSEIKSAAGNLPKMTFLAFVLRGKNQGSFACLTAGRLQEQSTKALYGKPVNSDLRIYFIN